MITSRFAPAPTGYLHLGHVLNAAYVWGVTRAAAGRVLLRIEDHDRQRSRDRYERAILDDLDWLGFVPDDPSTDAFRAGPCRGRQRDRQDVYLAAYARLHGAGLLYACRCTRRELQQDGATEVCYPGNCRSKALPITPGDGVRVRLEPSVVGFDDLAHGHQEQRPFEQCGDLLIRDRFGNWTYQFAVAVDDVEQEVTLVIRGDDLLSSSGRQIQLAALLGRRTPPIFLHHPLIMKSPTQKLSKADGDTSVRDMRLAGLSPWQVIGRALDAAGLIPQFRPLDAAAAGAIAADRFAAHVPRLRRPQT